MKKRYRIFIAISLPSEVKKYLEKFQQKWQDVPAKWTPGENLHITVLFLGDISSEDVGQVCMTVKEIVQNYNSFNITLQKIAYAPEGKIPPRYIWAGGEKSKELSQLKNDLQDALAEKVHFPKDIKSLTPHITLARIKEWEWRAIEPAERPQVEESIDLAFSVESLEVMESELKRGGPIYTVIESHQLT